MNVPLSPKKVLPPRKTFYPKSKEDEMASGMIDISQFPKERVLKAIYNRARPQGMGYIAFSPIPMTDDEARELLKQGTYFDYIKGRVLKVDLSKEFLDPRLYDRDNGEGTAEEAILKEMTTPDIP